MPLNREDPEVIALIEEVTSALAGKNKELLAELKKAKAKAQGADVDPEEHAALQARVEELQAELTKSAKTTKAEIDRLNKLATERETALNTHIVDAGITDALAKAGVAPHYVTAVKAMFRGQAKLQAADGNYSAVIGDKPVHEAIGAWAASDEGKHFVSAQNNTGGGAAGGAAKPAGGTKKWGEMSSEERVALYRKDPAAYAAAKKAA